MNSNPSRLSVLVALALACPLSGAFAQGVPPTAPDAGRLLQEQVAPPLPPKESVPLSIEVPPLGAVAPGGASAQLTAVSFAGNSRIGSPALMAVLGPVVGQRYDLAGLKGLADKISRHYREHGYPFARAYVPPQPLADGVLHIEVVEGRYGAVRAISKSPALAKLAERLLAPLHAGEVIEARPLERATLVLSDQPGLKVSPLVRPGQEVGTGDLELYVDRSPLVSGEVGVDNQGNRYTGQHRLHANLQFDAPFLAGDQLVVRGLYTQEDMWLGGLTYSLPLGDMGVRGNVGYARTSYALAKDFKNLLATGTARVTSAGMSYPILRSHGTNLSISVTWQRKLLDDTKQLMDLTTSKSSDSLPIALQFDRRDGLWGGGVVYGSLTFTPGSLKMDSESTRIDTTSGTMSQGGWEKWNLDLARLQRLPGRLSLYGRLSAQAASKNLDSSEKFSLGGATGVRGYPPGEATGDEGWLLQLELRYSFEHLTPYLFADAGGINRNTDPNGLLPEVINNHRSIGGEGVGVRAMSGHWSGDAAISWRVRGGKPQADSVDHTPLAWLSAAYKF